MGSPESTEEFPDRMKMDERTKIRKIHKSLKNKIKIVGYKQFPLMKYGDRHCFLNKYGIVNCLF